MKEIHFGNRAIKAREEDFGYTLFDGNVSVQINESFFDIISQISLGRSDEEIVKFIEENYDLSEIEKEKIINDIAYVHDYIKKLGWNNGNA